MSLKKDIDKLVEAAVISQETANKIEQYYEDHQTAPSNKLFIVFGILGAMLIGLGIILIIAHNWDEFPRIVKTSFAFLPLLIGQILCGYTLLKKQDNVTWRESTSTFLFFSIGASIALVSQIYNLPGKLSSFLFTWMLLCLPIMYLVRSSVVSLFYIVGIIYYSSQSGYWSNANSDSWYFWLLLLGALPYYITLLRNTPNSNFAAIHNWVVPIAILIGLGTVTSLTSILIPVTYACLLGVYYLIGNTEFFQQRKNKMNGYRIIGSLGTIILLMITSFDFSWKNLRNKEVVLSELIVLPDVLVASLLFILGILLLLFHIKGKSLDKIQPFALAFLLFTIIFGVGLYSPAAVFLINILLLVLGILTIKFGADQNHLGILNYGLLIVTMLIVCRFFDSDFSFVLRGVLFILIGTGFFAANSWLLKKRKINE